ncbi:hypothetical protein SDJN03_21666, partial [Cucurbita argyrosperma subsp. sororia]
MGHVPILWDQTQNLSDLSIGLSTTLLRIYLRSKMVYGSWVMYRLCWGSNPESLVSAVLVCASALKCFMGHVPILWDQTQNLSDLSIGLSTTLLRIYLRSKMVYGSWVMYRLCWGSNPESLVS